MRVSTGVAISHATQSPRDRRALAIVLVVQALAMLALGSVLGTWHDEEYTLATTAHGIVYAFHRAIDFELQAPFYFVVIAALRAISSSVFFARAFSIACAVAFVYAMALVARRIAPTIPPWIFAALVAINPFTIFAALEIRLYALALLLSALAWLAFYEGYVAGARARARIAFVALALVSLYTQYFIAFEFVAFAAGLAVLGRWRALRAYALACAIVALGFVPMLMVLHAQVGSAFAVRDVRPGAFGSVFLHPAIDFVYPLAYRSMDGRFLHVASIVGAVIFAIAIFVGAPRFRGRDVAYVAIAATVELIYVFLANVLGYELIVPRHFVALFLPEIAAAYAVVASFRSAVAKRATIVVVIIAAASALASDYSTYHTFAKHGDWKRVAAYLSAVARPHDTIAIFEADAIPSFRRYYRGDARIVPFPRATSPDRYDLDELIVHSVSEAEAALAALPHDGRLWFVNYGVCDRFDRLGCIEVRDAIARSQHVLERREFTENVVLRIEPRATATRRSVSVYVRRRTK